MKGTIITSTVPQELVFWISREPDLHNLWCMMKDKESEYLQVEEHSILMRWLQVSALIRACPLIYYHTLSFVHKYI